MRVLVANAGSSSLKLRLIGGGDEPVAALDLEPHDVDRAAAIAGFVADAGRIDAVGHRIVHGGARYQTPIGLGQAEAEQLAALHDLAPLHNGPALELAATLRDLCPRAPHIACFDTGFHATLPEEAALYALPRAWIERFGLRRYGFHGLSHAYAARRAVDLLRRAPDALRMISCHLGAGASLAAIAGGRSVDTTMGFTPNDGLVMATRSGAVDPGLLMWLQTVGGITAEDLDDSLEHESGLRGLSGTSGDMRDVLSAASRGAEQAATALAVYIHRLRGSIATMAAAMGGVDALVFTGGVGQRSPEVRGAACERLGFVGVELDPVRNGAAGVGDAEIGAETASVRTLVIEAREDLEIAAQVRAMLGES